ncbi:hypothetical protein [Burkholderia ubonensis]|uniref:hypothetical protein n=1 Tax=Burkholderia ubonensis TaxID=101571 RepID=UPI000A4E8B5D|nr:hypothetical protein [Burkholderia ubonensis]
MKPTFRAKDGRVDQSDDVMLLLAPKPDREATIAILIDKLKFTAEKASEIVDSE